MPKMIPFQLIIHLCQLISLSTSSKPPAPTHSHPHPTFTSVPISTSLKRASKRAAKACTVCCNFAKPCSAAWRLQVAPPVKNHGMFWSDGACHCIHFGQNLDSTEIQYEEGKDCLKIVSSDLSSVEGEEKLSNSTLSPKTQMSQVTISIHFPHLLVTKSTHSAPSL